MFVMVFLTFKKGDVCYSQNDYALVLEKFEKLQDILMNWKPSLDFVTQQNLLLSAWGEIDGRPFAYFYPPNWFLKIGEKNLCTTALFGSWCGFHRFLSRTSTWYSISWRAASTINRLLNIEHKTAAIGRRLLSPAPSWILYHFIQELPYMACFLKR